MIMRSRIKRDENGATLAIALIVIVVLSLFVSVTLTFQDTTLRAQSAMQDKRRVDLAADGAIDAVIGTVRRDPYSGTESDMDPSSDPHFCVGVESFDYVDPTLGDDMPVVIECTPDNDSGGTVGDSGIMPEHVLLALGGVRGDGNDNEGDIRFCDGAHPGKNGTCEAGIFVGTIDEDDDAGGLTVMANRSNPSAPLIRSNGAIISRGTRSLRVEAESDVPGWMPFQARRMCRNVNSYNTAGVETTATYMAAPYNACPPNGGAIAETAPYSEFAEDPKWTHEWRSPFEISSGGRYPVTNQPIDAGALRADMADVHGAYVNGKIDEGLLGNAIDAAKNNCSDGFIQFQPGWYSSLRFWDALGETCPSGTWHFDTGVYYFDFLDVGAASTDNLWREPTKYMQVVAGKPVGWTPGVESQPTKTMRANQMEEDGTKPKVWAAGEPSDPLNALTIDPNVNVWALHQLDSGSAQLEWKEFHTELPTQVPTTIDNLTVRVRERHVDTPPTPYAAGFPQVRIRVDGAGCTIDLTKDTDPTAGKITTDSDGALRIDITNGCPPAAEGGPASSSLPTTWTAKKVNDLSVTYEVKVKSGKSALVEVDGAELLVDYSGPPSPQFPGGCDPVNDGVQFIFGNLSRMKWLGQDVYFEMCGNSPEPRADPHAIGVYGLAYHDASVPVESVYSYYSGYEHAASGNRPRVTQVLPSPAAGTDAVDPWEVADSDAVPTDTSKWASGGFGSGSPYTYGVALPSDAIPEGSVLEDVQFRIRHAEPVLAGRGGVRSVKLKVQPTTAADNSDVENNESRSSSFSTLLGTANGVTLPSTVGVSYNDQFAAADPATRWVVPGSNPDTPRVDDPDTEGDETKWTTIYGDSEPEKRVIFDNLRTAAGINGLQIKLEAVPDGAGGFMAVDAIEVYVKYRPPGEPRPLRGCMTIRTSEDPALKDYSGVHPWMPPFAASNDQAYGWSDGDGTRDTVDCALMNVASRSNRQGTKFHLAGAAYAPTGALEFAGMDNDAQLVTDGVVARHISTVRWVRGPEIAAFGGGNAFGGLEDRQVTIVARVGTRIIADAHARFDDNNPGPDGLPDVEIDKWTRRP
ncbi:MAG: hypothetical protein ACT4OX_08240 [Actinomycetota bacterium]